MAKNNKLINQFKLMHRHIQNLTPDIYSAIAIAMHRKGHSFESIEEIFAESQVIWGECYQNGVSMPEMCKDETGIDVLGR